MASINVDEKTALAVMTELVTIGVAFAYSKPVDCTSKWAHRIEVDDTRKDLLGTVWSIIAERRYRAGEEAARIARKALNLPPFPTVGKTGGDQ
ncbi:hypothetical protein D3C81_1351000 [compost metagenome]